MMAALTYILCALTALLCSFLLFRGFRRNNARFLFWSGVCFLLLSFENAMLFIDVVIIPDVNLSLLRLAPGVIGIGSLLYGLIWETE